MKEKFFILAMLFLLFAIPVIAQTIEYDFLERKFTHTTRINAGDPVRFRINNVNPFLYKVKINRTEKSFDFSVPDLFKKYMGLDKSGKAPDSKDINALSSMTTMNKDFYVKYLGLLEKYDDVIENIFILQSNYEDIKYIISIDNRYDVLKEKLSKAIKKVEIIEYSRENFKYIYQAEEILNELSDIAVYLPEDCQNHIKRLKRNFDDSNPKEQLENIKTIYSVFENRNNFYVNSDESTVQSDVINYDIEIEKTGYDGKKGEKIKMSYSFNVSGGLKIDFSSGIFFSSVYDKDYYTYQESYKKDTSTILNYRIAEKNNSKIQPGICALLHLYKRRPGLINISLNMGIGLSMDNNSPTVRYLFGGSLIFGKEKRVLFNTGLSLGFTDVLRADLKNKDLFDSEPVIVKEKEFKAGYYFGISYNL